MLTDRNEGMRSARSLPDEYATLRTPAGERVFDLVARRWSDRSEGDRRQLAQVLVMVLEPLNHPGAMITEDLRDACESTVADWVRNTIPVADLMAGAPPAGGKLPGFPLPGSTRRLIRLVWADAPSRDGEALARVTLEGVTGASFAATVPANADLNDLLRAGAEATIQALRQAIASRGIRVDLRDVTTFDAFDNTGVIVAVAVTDSNGQWTAVGTCADVGSQPVRAAALAVLNAVNRRLGIG